MCSQPIHWYIDVLAQGYSNSTANAVELLSHRYVINTKKVISPGHLLWDLVLQSSTFHRWIWTKTPVITRFHHRTFSVIIWCAVLESPTDSSRSNWPRDNYQNYRVPPAWLRVVKSDIPVTLRGRHATMGACESIIVSEILCDSYMSGVRFIQVYLMKVFVLLLKILKQCRGKTSDTSDISDG